MRIGSLFSGIGGLEKGLEMAGLGETVWQVEADPLCRAVLEKHWPHVLRFNDVRTFSGSTSPVDLVCGGFPCQDVSSAGKGAGLAGARSGLWYEFRRIVGEARPRFALVENVASGARRWLPHVRRDLHVLGYRTRAFALSAADVGAPHLRRRIFVVAADPKRVQLRNESRWRGGPRREGAPEPRDDGSEGSLADADRLPSDVRSSARTDVPVSPAGGWWASEPEVGRVADGVPGRLDRLRMLGNAVVPQCAEAIGRVILELHEKGTGEQ